MTKVISQFYLSSLWLWGPLCALVVADCQQVLGQTTPSSATLRPIYWQEKLFYVPYQANKNGKLLERVDKVQLMLSRDGTSDWRVLQEARPNVQGFSYLAESDGEYWLALRHLDRLGRTTDSNTPQPQLRIIVDTKLPEIKLDATVEVSGGIVVRYESQDVNLDPKSLVLEARTGQGNWTQLTPTHDVAQPDKLLGRVNWSPPATASAVELRAAIADLAGQRTVAHAEVVVGEAALGHSGPKTQLATNALGSSQEKNLLSRTSERHSQDWPANNQSPRVTRPQQTPAVSSTLPPPIQNPYTAAGSGSDRTPARLIGERGRDVAGGQQQANSERGQTLGITPLDASNTPQSPPEHFPESWTVADGTSPPRLVNSRTFDMEYDIESVGPWGVGKVELWGTHDGGQTWQSYGADPDNRSPLRVTVPGSGIYGFRIVVHGAGGAPGAHPQAGDQPELRVAVDLLPPTVEILKAEVGQGDTAGQLHVEWTATDSNLEPRPIALFYSSQPNGPWSTIATRLENTGSYHWRIERHAPSRFYLRIVTHDTAGNQASHQTDSPLLLPREQPTGRLRSVKPVIIQGSESPRAAQIINQHVY